jgi:hypothetical protein
MPGYWWLRHRLSILIGGYCPRLSGSLGGEKAGGHPAAAFGAGGYSGRAGRARVASPRCKWTQIYA